MNVLPHSGHVRALPPLVLPLLVALPVLVALPLLVALPVLVALPLVVFLPVLVGVALRALAICAVRSFQFGGLRSDNNRIAESQDT